MPADRNPFQFHKGTIRTLWQTQLRRSIAHFNSIKVQLELAVQPNLLYIFRNFNSIKVQLEHLDGKIRQLENKDFNSIKVQLERAASLQRTALYPFQFHKGTIRTQPSVLCKEY